MLQMTERDTPNLSTYNYEGPALEDTLQLKGYKHINPDLGSACWAMLTR